MKTTLHHLDGMAFELTIDGHTLTLDAAPDQGGADRGPRPKPLLLAALAGCTAMDVVAILGKMKQTWSRLDVTTSGELTDEHPRVFHDFDVLFTVDGPVEPAKLARAVELSRDRYCGVSAMLRKHAPIRLKVMLNGEEVPLPPAP